MQTDFEDAPLRPVHIRVTIGCAGGVLSDGFALGIIGIALDAAQSHLLLTPAWLGAIGGASLLGLFVGAVLTGRAADRLGRRPVFAANMAVLALVSILQFFVMSPSQLLALRLVMGLVLGTDYVVSKALLVEYAPRRLRGSMLSLLSIAWCVGYTCAFFVGHFLVNAGEDAWRWILAASAVPALLVLPLRATVPESPRWLVARGRSSEARRIVREWIGEHVELSHAPSSSGGVPRQFQSLFSVRWRRRTLVACIFYTCQVIPFFALGTFIPKIMFALDVRDGYAGGLVYNLCLLLGAVSGLIVMNRISRRAFLVGSFAITAASLLPLSLWPELSSVATIALFAVFACVLSAAANLEYVYTPELFPTELRASGISVAIAASRIGSASSTFLLPIVMIEFGIRSALMACVLVLSFAGVVCLLWAPETRNARLQS